MLTYAAVPAGVTEDGTAALLFAVDHVYWTETIAAAANRHAGQATANRAGTGEIWFLGTASERARKELVALGFDVNDGVAAMMVAPSS